MTRVIQDTITFSVRRSSRLTASKGSAKEMEETKVQKATNLKKKTNENVQDVSPNKKAKKTIDNGLAEKSKLPLEEFIGREKEIAEINISIENCLVKKTSTSIYISGPPGTGKTASINHIINLLMVKHKFKLIYMNGMLFKTPISFYKQISHELNIDSKTPNRLLLDMIVDKLKTLKKSIVLILDEIDRLEDKNKDVLYNIFDWPNLPKSKIIIIGISNTLDLTTRKLDRMHRLKLDTLKEILFAPYTKDEIVSIIKNKFKNQQIVILPGALEFCARKVSSSSGDVRKAISIIRRTAEQKSSFNKAKGCLKLTNDDGFNEKRKKNPINVELKDIIEVINQVYGLKTFNASQSKTFALPVQEQIILSLCLLYSKNKSEKGINLGRCFETFKRICNKEKISYDCTTFSTFQTMCELLETKGMAEIKRSQIARDSKLFLRVDENEIQNIMQEKSLFSSIIDSNINLA